MEKIVEKNKFTLNKLNKRIKEGRELVKLLKLVGFQKEYPEWLNKQIDGFIGDKIKGNNDLDPRNKGLQPTDDNYIWKNPIKKDEKKITGPGFPRGFCE